jgi:hypothetical protein
VAEVSNPKKIILFVSIIFMVMALFPNQAIAAGGKDSTALKRKLIISVGVGDPIMIYVDNWIHNDYKFKNFPKVTSQINPVYAKVEYRILRHIGIGVDLSYDDYEARKAPASNTNYAIAYKGSNFVADIRLNRHIHLINKRLDLYFGVGLGYQVQSIENIINTRSLPKPGSNNLAFELTVGARFYLTKRIGLYAEGGLARSIIQGGLVIRL